MLNVKKFVNISYLKNCIGEVSKKRIYDNNKGELKFRVIKFS